MGKKIVDGAYKTMIERLQSNSNPNFFFLNYDTNSFDIVNFIVIPKYFFVPEIIEKRKPYNVPTCQDQILIFLIPFNQATFSNTS